MSDTFITADEHYGHNFIREVCHRPFASIGPRPTAKHSLDRRNNDGHYELGNVRWATTRQQLLNRRRARRMRYLTTCTDAELLEEVTKRKLLR